MNFLQRAVASVESQLDQVLANEQAPPTQRQPRAQRQMRPPRSSTEKKEKKDAAKPDEKVDKEADKDGTGEEKKETVVRGGDEEKPRTSTSSEQQAAAELRKDTQTPPPSTATPPPASTPRPGRMTMQERLAAAMARGASSSRGQSPAGTPARSVSPLPTVVKDARKSTDSARDSLDIKDEKRPSEDNKDDTKTEEVLGKELVKDEGEKKEAEELKTDTPTITLSTDEQVATTDVPPPVVAEVSVDSKNQVNGATAVPSAPQTREELEATIEQLKSDLLLCETRRQEELQQSAERIEALEDNVKYLSREAADEAKERAYAAGSSAEKELAKRDERIALLMEEGAKLSKQELKHMNTIRKLRAKTTEEEKATAEAKRKQEKAEKDANDFRERLKKATEVERQQAAKLKAFAKVDAELENLRNERDSLKKDVADLKAKLAEVTAKADERKMQLQTEALEAEKKKALELKMQLESVRGDLVASREAHKTEVANLRSKMDRDAERARQTQAELKNELAMMETKTELLLTRAEEVSSGASGDAHAKLLRQIETLQSQYAVATENWQGIEASMLARLNDLEKERDELSKKEADIRKKAREFNLKAKKAEADLDLKESKVRDLEGDLDMQKHTAEQMKKKTSQLESELSDLKLSHVHERDNWEKELVARIDEERLKWEEFANRSGSPAAGSLRRKSSFTSNLSVPYAMSNQQQRRTSRPNSADPNAIEAMMAQSRRSSTHPLNTFLEQQRPGVLRMESGSSTPLSNGRPDSSASLPMIATNIPPAQSMYTAASMSQPTIGTPAGADDNDSIFDGPPMGTGSTGPSRIDALSVSTVGAGPSVQLVERMSAAVRRLETEMAASREELTRLTEQRDEARNEVVNLMSEVEEKRTIEKKCKELEEKVGKLDAVHQTTLELLGEKSEEVEELKADVMDLKQMYRNLIMQQTNAGGA